MVDSEGAVRWRLEPNDLFDEYHLDPRDMLTQGMILDSFVSIIRADSRALLVHEREGLHLIDYETGDVLARYRADSFVAEHVAWFIVGGVLLLLAAVGAIVRAGLKKRG